MAWFLPSCSCCNVERSNGGERSEPELTTASGYAPERSEYWFKHLYQASACFSAFILFEKIPGHVFRRFAYSPQPGAGSLPGGMGNLRAGVPGAFPKRRGGRSRAPLPFWPIRLEGLSEGWRRGIRCCCSRWSDCCCCGSRTHSRGQSKNS